MIYSGNYTTITEVEGSIIYLDLQKTMLFGFHKTVDKSLVDKYRVLIREGVNFPAVMVTTTDSTNFYLTFLLDPAQGKPDGGHHRAFSFYLENEPLLCKKVSNEHKATYADIPIKDLRYKK